jgi:hypothetical protein
MKPSSDGTRRLSGATPIGPPPIQKIIYLYRDAANYKFWGEFCVSGQISLADLRPYLLDSEYFVPQKIGIPSLVPQCQNDDDHTLHEIDSMAPCENSPCVATADELIARFRKVNGNWF